MPDLRTLTRRLFGNVRGGVSDGACGLGIIQRVS